jgi:hypothetical protein
MRSCHIALGILFLLGAQGVSSAQLPALTQPPDYFVRLNDHRSVFYHDEDVPFSIFWRSGKPAPAGCSFGSSEKMQVLKNGRVIREDSSGGVQTTWPKTVGGIAFQSTDGSFALANGRQDDVNLAGVPSDRYQIRFTCGSEISEPSRPFHFSLWNKPVDGLTVRVLPLKQEFRRGESVGVRVTMKNVGTRQRRSPVPLADDGQQRSFWSLEPYCEDPRSAPPNRLAFGRGSRSLKPGQSWSAVFQLNHFQCRKDNHIFILGNQPGTYRLWFEVWIHIDDGEIPRRYRANLWNDELTSTIFTIVVK